MATQTAQPPAPINTFGQPISVGGGTIVPQGIINPLPQSPVPPPKTIAVATGKAAADDYAMKQVATNDLTQQVAQNAVNQAAQGTGTSTQRPVQQSNSPTVGDVTTQAQPTNATLSSRDQILQMLLQNPDAKLTQQQAQQIAGMNLQGVTVNADGTYKVSPGAVVQAQNGQQAGTPGAPGMPKTQMPSTGNAVLDYVNQQKMNLDAQQDVAFQAYMRQVQQIQTGTFPMTAQQQAQVNELQRQFQSLRDAQMQANEQHIQAVQALGIRTGRSQYMPGVQEQDISSAMTEGIQALADLNTRANDAVAKLQEGFLTQDYNMVNDMYGNLTKYMDNKTKTLNDMVASVKDAVELQTQQTQQKKNLIDLQTAQTNSIARAVADTALKPDGTLDLQAIQDAADNYGIDPATLYSAVQGEAHALKLQGEAEQKFQAELAQTKAQTAKTYMDIAKAKQDQTAGNVVQGLPQDKVNALQQNGFTRFNGTTQGLAEALVKGQIAPAELSKRTTGTSSYNDVLNAARLYSQGVNGKDFNISQADRDYKYATNINTQNTLNYLGSLVGQADPQTGKFSGGNLGDLRRLSDEVGRTNFPALNNAAAWTRYSIGDPKITAFQATATEVADQVAKILQGGGTGSGTSDAKLQQAVNLFNTGFSKKQLAAVIDALEPLLSNRAKAMVGDNPYLSDYANQFGFDQTNVYGQKEQAPQAPTKGAVGTYNGFQYTFDGTQWVKNKQ